MTRKLNPYKTRKKILTKVTKSDQYLTKDEKSYPNSRMFEYHNGMENELGKLLRFYRTRKNLTQSEVGNELDVASYVISDYERGRAQPSVGTLLKMSRLYEATIDELVGNTYVPGKVEDPHFDQLVKLVNSYSGKQRDVMIDLAMAVMRKTNK